GLQRVEEVGLEGRVALVRPDEVVDKAEEGHDVAAAVLTELAADEIERLDAVGALVDHRDPGIADELGDAGLLDIAVAAEDLLGEDGGFEALVGQEALEHRGEQRDEPAGGLVAGAG